MTEQTTAGIWRENLQKAKDRQDRHGDKHRFIEKIKRIKETLAKMRIPAKPIRTVMIFDSKVNYL